LTNARISLRLWSQVSVVVQKVQKIQSTQTPKRNREKSRCANVNTKINKNGNSTSKPKMEKNREARATIFREQEKGLRFGGEKRDES